MNEINISKVDFDVLLYIEKCQRTNVIFSVAETARELFKNEQDILNSLSNLHNKELIENDNVLTKKGVEYLESHKIDNAIILAAGMSTRFVPINFEMPKGLIEVKGEKLIERQIRQLNEVGIKEIYIVVGYMHERFEYLKDKFGVELIYTDDYKIKNNHASVYAAKDHLKNSIITSSDLYFDKNIFQKYAYDSYYCTIYIPGKTAERGIVTDNDDKIIETMYGDRCYDIWVTLGYAYFAKKFSDNMIDILTKEMNIEKNYSKFWADFQDEHLDRLYMYAKRVDSSVIHEFDSLEELREFDSKYKTNSGSVIMHKLCHLLAANENEIINLELLKKIKPTMFKFDFKDNTYICDINPDDKVRIIVRGRIYYQCREDDTDSKLKLYKMDKNILIDGKKDIDVEKDLNSVFELTKDFIEYHKRAVPLCAAENVVSKFVNAPLGLGFQERYIMNNTYSFNMDDNFIGCEKLFPFYQKLSEVCEKIFDAKYVDPRPFTGMHCIDMVTKTICKPGEKMMILSKEHGGHASVKPVVERLGLVTYEAPYNIDKMDLDTDKLNEMVKKEGIKYILLAPSDIIKPLSIDKIDTTNCVLMWDASQLLGLIAAGLCFNPLKTMKNVVMFGGTHKTFPGPASGLILTNEKNLHELMEKEINPKLTRHSQMHQKISLLFALIEFEKYGTEYMSHMVHCSNYLGARLREYGYDIADVDGKISETHQIFIRCDKKTMDTIYNNAYRCEVTLNKKHKDLFRGYGVRLGTQEIARYAWDDKALDIVAEIISMLKVENVSVEKVKTLVNQLPVKDIKFTFNDEVVNKYLNI